MIEPGRCQALVVDAVISSENPTPSEKGEVGESPLSEKKASPTLPPTNNRVPRHSMTELASSGSNQDVSVVVPTRNSAKTLVACLRSVIREKPGEVIGVDMQSNDATLRIFENLSIRVVCNRTRSLGHSRQLGLEASNLPLVMFVDSDMTLSPGCIASLTFDLQRHEWDGVHASVRSSENETYWQRAEDSRISMFLNQSGSKVFNSLAAALFRREALLENPFDPEFAESCEDVDLCLRLVQAGRKLGVSKVIAYHKHRREFREFAIQRVRDGLGLSRMARKRRSIKMLLEPLKVTLSSSLRSAMQGRIWLVPYWIADGTCKSLGVIMGIRSYKRAMLKEKRAMSPR